MRPKSGRADLGFAHRIGQAAKIGAAGTTAGTPKVLATRRRSRFRKSLQGMMRLQMNEITTRDLTFPSKER